MFFILVMNFLQLWHIVKNTAGTVGYAICVGNRMQSAKWMLVEVYVFYFYSYVPSNVVLAVGTLVWSSAGIRPICDRVRSVDADVIPECNSGSSTSDISSYTDQPCNTQRTTTVKTLSGRRTTEALSTRIQRLVKCFSSHCQRQHSVAWQLPWQFQTPSIRTTKCWQ